MKRLHTSLLLLAALITLTGCATHMIRLQPVRAAFQRGDVAEADRLIALAQEVMSQAAAPAVALSVPLDVDARAGATWGQAH